MWLAEARLADQLRSTMIKTVPRKIRHLDDILLTYLVVSELNHCLEIPQKSPLEMIRQKLRLSPNNCEAPFPRSLQTRRAYQSLSTVKIWPVTQCILITHAFVLCLRPGHEMQQFSNFSSGVDAFVTTPPQKVRLLVKKAALVHLRVSSLASKGPQGGAFVIPYWAGKNMTGENVLFRIGTSFGCRNFKPRLQNRISVPLKGSCQNCPIAPPSFLYGIPFPGMDGAWVTKSHLGTGHPAGVRFCVLCYIHVTPQKVTTNAKFDKKRKMEHFWKHVNINTRMVTTFQM